MCRQVSWVRRQDNGEKVNLLTVGQQTYIGDPRYTVMFQYPDNWRLQIRPVNSSDEGQYECQVSTHPPKYIHVNLHINGKYRNNSLLSIVRLNPHRQIRLKRLKIITKRMLSLIVRSSYFYRSHCVSISFDDEVNSIW